MSLMTYVKSDTLTAAGTATAAVVVDLGLSLNEAAKIVGIELALSTTIPMVAGLAQIIQAAYSFDPEDLLINGNDDEQFAQADLVTGSIAATTGAHKQSEFAFFDFSGMTLVTTRNLALLLNVVVTTGVVIGKVYYERFKPTASELMQLIATRR